MAITQDEAHGLLEPHYERIFRAVTNGYDGYRKYPERAIHRRGTRASIVNDRILARIIEEFDEVDGARYIEAKSANLRFMEIGGKVLLWFKKTDLQHRPHENRTKLAERLESGAQLAMFPQKDILIVGYLLNREETKVIRVSISKPDGIARQPSWFIDLDLPQDNKLTVIPRASGGDHSQLKSRVRVKMSEPQMGLFS